MARHLNPPINLKNVCLLAAVNLYQYRKNEEISEIAFIGLDRRFGPFSIFVNDRNDLTRTKFRDPLANLCLSAADLEAKMIEIYDNYRTEKFNVVGVFGSDRTISKFSHLGINTVNIAGIFPHNERKFCQLPYYASQDCGIHNYKMCARIRVTFYRECLFSGRNTLSPIPYGVFGNDSQMHYENSGYNLISENNSHLYQSYLADQPVVKREKWATKSKSTDIFPGRSQRENHVSDSLRIQNKNGFKGKVRLDSERDLQKPIERCLEKKFRGKEQSYSKELLFLDFPGRRRCLSDSKSESGSDDSERIEKFYLIRGSWSEESQSGMQQSIPECSLDNPKMDKNEDFVDGSSSPSFDFMSACKNDYGGLLKVGACNFFKTYSETSLDSVSTLTFSLDESTDSEAEHPYKSVLRNNVHGLHENISRNLRESTPPFSQPNQQPNYFQQQMPSEEDSKETDNYSETNQTLYLYDCQAAQYDMAANSPHARREFLLHLSQSEEIRNMFPAETSEALHQSDDFEKRIFIKKMQNKQLKKWKTNQDLTRQLLKEN